MPFNSRKPVSKCKAGEKSAQNPSAGPHEARKSAEPETNPAPDDVPAPWKRLLKRPDSKTNQQPINDISAPVREALTAIETSLFSIDRIRETIEQAFEIVLSANDVEAARGRALLSESYNEMRRTINEIVINTDTRAADLIGSSPRQIDVSLNDKAYYSIFPMRLDTSDSGLNLEPPKNAFATFDEITTTLEQLDNGLKKADNAAAAYCKDAQYLIGRMKKVG